MSAPSAVAVLHQLRRVLAQLKRLEHQQAPELARATEEVAQQIEELVARLATAYGIQPEG